MNFPETLQKMMETKGVTKYRLAKDLGVSQSSVANWLNGSSPHPFMLDIYDGKDRYYEGKTHADAGLCSSA